jgi:hypothetical protein
LHCYFLCIGNWGLTDVAMSSCLLWDNNSCSPERVGN